MDLSGLITCYRCGTDFDDPEVEKSIFDLYYDIISKHNIKDIPTTFALFCPECGQQYEVNILEKQLRIADIEEE